MSNSYTQARGRVVLQSTPGGALKSCISGIPRAWKAVKPYDCYTPGFILQENVDMSRSTVNEWQSEAMKELHGKIAPQNITVTGFACYNHGSCIELYACLDDNDVVNNVSSVLNKLRPVFIAHDLPQKRYTIGCFKRSYKSQLLDVFNVYSGDTSIDTTDTLEFTAIENGTVF